MFKKCDFCYLLACVLTCNGLRQIHTLETEQRLFPCFTHNFVPLVTLGKSQRTGSFTFCSLQAAMPCPGHARLSMRLGSETPGEAKADAIDLSLDLSNSTDLDPDMDLGIAQSLETLPLRGSRRSVVFQNTLAQAKPRPLWHSVPPARS